MDKAGFIIYPNPGSGVFTLNMDLHGSEDVEFQIFDMAGRLILAKKISNVSDKLETRIDLSGYAPGLYQIHIKTGNTLHHGIMVKE